ncbi:MAG TPA: NAD(P)H-quinone oxidoreductase [Myxococcaceae bacterium]|nr:NAD(P)H-quinone oxidoreductase [Myxococcaceae bacterium]
MRAVRIEQPGSVRGLRLAEVEEPVPGPGEIAVDVQATALNRADWLQVLGKYPVPPGTPADLPGMEYAGTVRTAGPRAVRFRPGDRVMGLVPGAAFAERLVTHEREAVSVPGSLSLTEAAAIPEAFFTAFDALVLQGRLGAGERVLVHAVASGVGTAAAQIVHTAGATLLGTGRAAGKLERVSAIVPFTALSVDRDAPRFAERVLEATGGAGADLVLDLVGGRYTAESLACLAPRGRMVLVGTVDGVKSELDLRLMLGKRLQITGTVLRARPLEEKMALARAVERHVLPLFACGTYRPVVDRVLPMDRVAEAFEHLVADRNVGKIVLAWSGR